MVQATFRGDGPARARFHVLHPLRRPRGAPGLQPAHPSMSMRIKPPDALIPPKSAMEAQSVPPAAAEGAGRAAEGAEDRELVRRAQGGDEAAFRSLVERHGGRAHALALRILRSASDAEEVAQDAF